MSSYYDHNLSAQRLMQCYEIAPPRVQQYLDAEVEHVLKHIRPGDEVLELGCGYGRILPQLAVKAGWAIGIDTSLESLKLGREMLSDIPNCLLLQIDAIHLAFRDRIFDRVFCVQNGISAFHVNPGDLIRESLRVTKPGGTVLYSSYSDRFWEHRLEWFERQSEAGLLGEINYEKTRDGMIACRDGFTATTVRPDQFLSLTAGFAIQAKIVEVDSSSLFCEITPR